MTLPVAHLLSPDLEVRRQVLAALVKAFKVETFDSVAGYERYFGGWIDEAFRVLVAPRPEEREGGVIPPGERPELVIVDVNTPPEAVDRRLLIQRIQDSNRLQEILILTDELRVDRIGYLVARGSGNVFEWPGLEARASVEEELLRESRRLLEISRKGLEAAVYRRIGKRVMLRDRSSQVFLSQSSDCGMLAFGVRRFVEMSGHRVWYSVTDGADDPADATKEEMERALRRTRVMIALVTPQWLEHPRCQQELADFEKEGKVCLPIVVDPALENRADVKAILGRHEGAPKPRTIGSQVIWARDRVLGSLGPAGGV